MNTAVHRPMYGWKDVPWTKVERAVFKLRQRIYRASLRGDHKTVHSLQRLLTSSRAARLLAVRRITQENRGKRTAGIDGVKSVAPSQRLALADSLRIGCKAAPVRRVWIPKTGSTDVRPLGIPTIENRATQMLMLLALEPEWEARFESNSYGFRPGRGAHDAIEAIFIAIAQKAKYALDADIETCYDHIRQDHLLAKLQTTPHFRRQIAAWLRAGVVDGEELFPTEEGVPQGGPLSCLLANVALHGLESAVHRAFPTRWGAPLLVRYADDLVVLHADREVVERCREIISAELAPLGLQLNDAKTRIAHTLFDIEGEAGFSFLGFSIRQYAVGKHRSGRNGRGRRLGVKTYITPSRKAVTRHWLQLRQIIDSHKAARQAELIGLLNPVTRGWSNYYSAVCSKRTFGHLDYQLHTKLMRWARRRHPTKGRKWVAAKYWRVDDGAGWVFSPSDSTEVLRTHAATPIRRHVKVRGTRSPYDGDWVYWSKRSSGYKGVSRRVAVMTNRQRGRCRWCRLWFHPDDLTEVDHIIPRALGGRDAYHNLQLLHMRCHAEKTAQDLEEQRRTEHVLDEIRGMRVKH